MYLPLVKKVRIHNFCCTGGNSERMHETHTSEVHQRDYETGTSEDHQRVGENGTFESMWGRDCRILAADTSEEQRLYQAKILKINVVM